MAFVNEEISENDQIRINYGSLRNPQGQRKLAGIPKWTVDRERDVFLIRLGGGISREDYHILYYFLFSLKEEKIMVEAFQKRIPTDDPMLGIVIYQVTKLQLPENFRTSRKKVLQLLEEAFSCYGYTGTQWSHLNLKSVEVDFSKVNGGK